MIVTIGILLIMLVMFVVGYIVLGLIGILYTILGTLWATIILVCALLGIIYYVVSDILKPYTKTDPTFFE